MSALHYKSTLWCHLKWLCLLVVFILLCESVQANPDAKRLYDDLLSNYNRLIRPVSNNTDTVLVKLGLRLSQLIDLNLKDQILTTNVWLEHEWQDHKFKWDPSEYGGVTELYVPSEHIWLPDIVLYNNADGEYVVTTMTKAILHYTGKVVWTPPAIFKSSCEIDVRYFPFDQQTCFMKFGSWTYDGDQIDLKHINQKNDKDNKVEIGIDLREYYPSVEWDILGVPAERHEKYYPCCAEPYPDIFFNITLRRKTLFYTVNLIIPTVGISYLSVLVFYLPADSGEKIALCISILLSQTMFFLLISEIIPSTSLALPLLGKYLLFTMLLVGLSVVITIIILNIHYRKPSTHRMAPWVRSFFIKRLPKLLLMRVPNDLLRDLAASKVNYGMNFNKTKFGKALMDEMNINSGNSSPDSIRRMQGRVGNGLSSASATNRFSGMMGVLGGGLSTLSGYNGLPSVLSGLDDSLSDVAPRKKYPFELEKAIHNVMFIQNHMQRQDEFNAEDQDWGFVAMVLDRLFLWIFAIASLVGTFMILGEAPSLYDDTKPIDVELSVIAQQIYNLTEKKS
ncbi:acetylcholine receptor subunit alpha-like 2 [Lucilia cuprina]|uniref:Nicotinic acetylcholine receptor alpha2 subunit n=1 Tax=Lucilia cuprina TaxID=7375 RepID=K7WZZ6_LUCCU|nr:acetylcholine receptor subunit alpha-like 2 [Lucilia cuprina]XP_037808411.1 acetylcholine receptor subunit alpha-like 2 [Lucilia sericata]XP_037808412.1 acetylcholine receptor subunit alpha-like 2 [Lucilia sericata]XP_037808413.1 acetylcholine receptor subunit alpha-like 2 [Lucilia sericata]XP_046805192.1 acetylcholine receptor subunit alpha-like 2 [Lucilia cuprina]XP_046805193.1 acetylcholine receptor subunit alpha-like 2 [Lucilia cuprina]AFX68727.1 nicotinic acetylcholine receptor alpha2